jgi:hypothetical protein
MRCMPCPKKHSAEATQTGRNKSAPEGQEIPKSKIGETKMPTLAHHSRSFPDHDARRSLRIVRVDSLSALPTPIMARESAVRLTLLLCLLALPMLGNELPDAPKPNTTSDSLSGFVEAQPKPVTNMHPFWDKPNKVEAASMFAMASLDMAQTCYGLAHGGRELHLTQSCVDNNFITFSFEAATVTGTWLLHRTNHHKLERMPMLYMVGVSTSGVVGSKPLF